VPRKKNRAAQPIGPGKAGSMKRAVYKAGGGKKLLKRLRANANKGQRKAIANTPGLDIKGFEAMIRKSAGVSAKRAPVKTRSRSKVS